MGLSEVQEVEQPKIDKKWAKRRLWVEYIKGVVTVFIFLVGLALVTSFINGYFAVKYSNIFGVHSGYRNIVLILCLAAYILLFFSVYKILGLKITDKIDQLNKIINRRD